MANHRQARATDKAIPVGLIGVGLLGTALAERLSQHDYPLLAYDIDPRRVSALPSATQTKATHADDAGQVVTNCRHVLLCLPTSDIVEQLLRDNADYVSADQVFVDTTTGSPRQMERHATFLRELDARYVEATVAGSSHQMRRGEAALFLGAEGATLTHVSSLLSCIAPKHFHLGPVGSASRFKLVHNLVLGLHRAVLAEGLTFGQAMGFDPAAVLAILQESPAASATMATKGHKMVAGDFEPQARLSQHLKDVRLILEESKRLQVATPLSQLHAKLLEQAERLGFGAADNSAIIESYRSQSGD